MHALLCATWRSACREEIDPDRLVTGDPDANRDYLALQEGWMSAPLPDGRVPMTALLDEQDEGFLADWAAADAEALGALRSVLDGVGQRPLPAGDLRVAARRLREEIGAPRLAGTDARLVQRAHRGSPPADDAGDVAHARHIGRVAPG